MRRKRSHLTGLKVFGLFAVGVTLFRPAPELSGSSLSTQEIVDQFFPPGLNSGIYPSWARDTRKSAFVVIEQLASGDPKTIVAAYTNGSDGTVRVIQVQSDGTYALAFEPAGLDLGGLDVAMEPLVIDQSGRPTVEVSFGAVRPTSADWIFRWDGTNLINLTPMETEKDGSKYTLLCLSKFVDLDHDGDMEIISEESYPPPVVDTGELPDAAESVYRLTPSGYVLDRPVLFFSYFSRKTATPTTEIREFSLLKNSAGPYVLKITNGDRDGSNRISSAHILLNGVEVVTPNMLNQGAEFLSIPVALQPHNTLEVTLTAKPQGSILLTVEDTSASRPPPQPPQP